MRRTSACPFGQRDRQEDGRRLISRGHIYHILSNPSIPDGFDIRERFTRGCTRRSSMKTSGAASRTCSPSKRSGGRLQVRILIPSLLENSLTIAATEWVRACGQGGRRWPLLYLAGSAEGRSQDAGSVTRVPARRSRNRCRKRSELSTLSRAKRKGQGFVDRSILTSSGKTNDRPTAANTNMPHPEPSTSTTASRRHRTGHGWQGGDRDPPERGRGVRRGPSIAF